MKIELIMENFRGQLFKRGWASFAQPYAGLVFKHKTGQGIHEMALHPDLDHFVDHNDETLHTFNTEEELEGILKNTEPWPMELLDNKWDGWLSDYKIDYPYTLRESFVMMSSRYGIDFKYHIADNGGSYIVAWRNQKNWNRLLENDPTQIYFGKPYKNNSRVRVKTSTDAYIDVNVKEDGKVELIDNVKVTPKQYERAIQYIELYKNILTNL